MPPPALRGLSNASHSASAREPSTPEGVKHPLATHIAPQVRIITLFLCLKLFFFLNTFEICLLAAEGLKETPNFEQILTVTISGRVAYESPGGLQGLPEVKMFFVGNDGQLVTQTTDSDGYYRCIAVSGWSGTVIPFKARYTFSPGQQAYNRVYEDRPHQDYVAEVGAPTVTLSGQVTTPDGNRIAGVILEFAPQSHPRRTHYAVTDENGHYNHLLPRDWSGTVRLYKGRYTFTLRPPSHENSTDSSTGTDSPTGQKGTAAESPLIISGRVTDEQGVGLPALTITYSAAPTSSHSFKLPKSRGFTVTDVNGYYSLQVPLGWSGTVIPSLARQYFPMPSRSTANHYCQDFTAFPQTPLISGRGIFAGDVGYVFVPGVGWYGEVVPHIKGFLFQPSLRVYEALTASQWEDNYEAVAMPLFISGRITTAEGEPVDQAVLRFSNPGGSAVTSSDGYYVHPVSYGWQGEVIPRKQRFTFFPAAANIDEIANRKYNWDFLAQERRPVISGSVIHYTKDEDIGLPDVKLYFSGRAGEDSQTDVTSTSTDKNGDYSIVVPYNWSGDVKPQKQGFHFSPSRQSIGPVLSDRGDQNFNAGSGSITLSLRVSKVVEGALVLKKQYVKIQLTLEEISEEMPRSLSCYRLYRESAGGKSTRDIPPSKLKVGVPHIEHDQEIQKGIIYTYTLKALDADYISVGESNEETISF